MVTVTGSAKELLKETLTTHSNDPDMGVRLALDPEGQLGLSLGKEQPDDQVVEHQESKVLLVASELALALGEVTLDVKDKANGPKLVLQKK